MVCEMHIERKNTSRVFHLSLVTAQSTLHQDLHHKSKLRKHVRGCAIRMCTLQNSEKSWEIFAAFCVHCPSRYLATLSVQILMMFQKQSSSRRHKMHSIHRAGPGRLCTKVGFLRVRSWSDCLHPLGGFSCLPRPRESFPTALMAMSRVSMDMFLVSLVSRVFLPESKVESSPVVSRLGACRKLPGRRSCCGFWTGNPLPLPRCAANKESLTPLQLHQSDQKPLGQT